MDYFNDIEFISFNHMPECRAEIKKYFHDYHVLDCCSRGQVRLQLDDDPPIELKAPVIWFTFPGPFTRFEPSGPEKSWEHRYIAFRGKRVAAWLKAGLLDFNPRQPYVGLTDPVRFVSQMDAVMKYIQSPVYGWPRAVLMFEDLLLQLQEQQEFKAVASVTDSRVAQYIQQLDDVPEKPWDFKADSRKMGLSYPHFRFVFHNLTGFPPHRYLIRRRMEKASLLLRKNELEIKKIAILSGYEDIFHFAKLFKSYYKISPGRFRDKNMLR